MTRLPENHSVASTCIESGPMPALRKLETLAQEIKEEVRYAESQLRDSIQAALRAGECLCRAKALVQHGQWASWFESRDFAFSERSAQRYMRLFLKWKERSNSQVEGANPTALSDLTMSDVLEAHAKRTTSQRTGTRIAGARNEPSSNTTAKLGLGISTHPEKGKMDNRSAATNHSRTPRDDSDVVEPGRAVQVTSISNVRQSVRTSSSSLTRCSSDEWLTPLTIVNAVERVLGSIDLDPAADAAKRIPASKHFTAVDNGLSASRKWHGKVFLCPPVDENLISKFASRLLKRYLARCVDEAILIVPCRTDQHWFRAMRTCMRSFIAKPEFGSVDGMPEPIVAIYLGDRTARFYDEFERLGDCYVPYCAKHLRHLDLLDSSR